MPRSPHLMAALAALFLSAPAFSAANDSQSLYQQAIKALNGDGRAVDLAAGRELLEKAASAGSTQAMQRLGEIYRDGDAGIARDPAKSFEWFNKEAALPNGARGMIGVAAAYERGLGVGKDVALSEEWYKKAAAAAQKGAAAGDVDSMIALAIGYAQGRGIKQDPVQAWNWAIKASEKPNIYAYELMAAMSSGGIGVQANDEAALRYILKAAQMGAAQSMVAASVNYSRGIGITRDPKGALEWIQKAVERGNGKAVTVLGTYQHNGVGLTRDDAAAKVSFQRGVDMGDEEAMGHMGELFLDQPAEIQTALSWFRKGTEAGDAASMYYLARMYAEGRPVERDLSQSVSLLRSSSDLGYAESMNFMGELLRYGRVNGGGEEAVRWFRNAAGAGSAAGMRNLWQMLHNQAIGELRDKKDDDLPKLAEALSWLKKAAAANDVEATVNLADVHLTGTLMPQNGPAAAALYKRAADAGDVTAMRKLGILYADGDLISRDIDKAMELLTRAASAQDGPAMTALGEIYEEGDGKFEKDLDVARAWFERAARQRDPGAFRNLAQIYQEGWGVEQNLAAAVSFYEQAVAAGDLKSMEYLGRMLDLGQGVPKSPQNKERAVRLFKEAYEKGGATTARDWLMSQGIDPDAATRPATTRSGGPGPIPLLPGPGGPPAGGAGRGRGRGN